MHKLYRNYSCSCQVTRSTAHPLLELGEPLEDLRWDCCLGFSMKIFYIKYLRRYLCFYCENIRTDNQVLYLKERILKKCKKQLMFWKSGFRNFESHKRKKDIQLSLQYSKASSCVGIEEPPASTGSRIHPVLLKAFEKSFESQFPPNQWAQIMKLIGNRVWSAQRFLRNSPLSEVRPTSDDEVCRFFMWVESRKTLWENGASYKELKELPRS